MLTKLATFRGVSAAGEPLVQVFRPGERLVKVAGTVMPEVQQWLTAYKSDQQKIALLVNALGASEYWGQNINGDIFPESALIHDCRRHPSEMHPVDDLTGRTIPAYGYPTFLQALPYVHHRNKDPSRAFGNVVVSCWNPKMHRVELVVILDRGLALQHGASGVIDRIDAGEYPDVSMGCKVPWDQCTICNHRSKTREDYCSCVKNIGLGRILDDGRRIGVVNVYPRFFDISFVFIGADKTAKVMTKLGSSVLPQSVVDADMIYDTRALCGAQDCRECAGCKVKAASVKHAESMDTNDADPENMLIDRGERPREAPPPGHRTKRPELPVEQLIFGRRDWQGERAGNGDGILATNMNMYANDDPWEKVSASRIPKIIAGYAEKAKALPKPGLITPTLLGTGTGALTGAALGGVAAPEGERVPSALLGGLGGAVLGTGAGGLAGLARRAEMKGLQREIGGLQRRASTMKPKKIAPSKAVTFSKKEVKRLSDRIEKARAMRDSARLRGDAESFAHHRANIEDMKVLKSKAQKDLITRMAEHAKRKDIGPQLQALRREAAQTLTAARGIPKGFPLGAPVGGVLAGTAAGLAAPSLPALAATDKVASSVADSMFEAAKSIKIGPPPQPNRKEFPFLGTINFRGININVENVPGSWRTGKGWKTLMRLPYGEFAKTKGMDGDKLDAYVGPYTDAANVYVIHQNVPQTGKYDEDKVMIGFQSPEQAKAAYLAHYSDPRFFRSITTMSFNLFKRALLGGEVDGQKVAGIRQELTKIAADMRLEDLFEDRPGRVYRDRMWRDKETGNEVHRRGSGLAKHASVAAPSVAELLKLSDQQKWADIVKEIGPDKAVGRVSPALSDAEPTMDRAILDEMGRSGIQSALATPSLLGMVLKPEEFQRLALCHMGHPEAADEMDANRCVFDPAAAKDSTPLCDPLEPEQASDSLLQRLKDLIESRSYLGPVVRRRMIRVAIKAPGQPMREVLNYDSGPQTEGLGKTAKGVNSFLLSKVASAYNWYRCEQLKVATAAPEFIAGRPELRSRVLGLDDADLFSTKTADIGGLSKGQLAMVLGSVPLTLMYSAHLKDQERMGRQLGFLESMVAGSPWFTSVGIAGVLRELLKSPQARNVMQAAAEKVRSV